MGLDDELLFTIHIHSSAHYPYKSCYRAFIQKYEMQEIQPVKIKAFACIST